MTSPSSPPCQCKHNGAENASAVQSRTDGRRDLLIDVPRYDFNWQTTYFLREPLPLPKGTKLECTGWFDNSANNPANPDPSQTIHWGDQSWEEMNVGFMELAFDRRSDGDIVKLSDTTKPAAGPGR